VRLGRLLAALPYHKHQSRFAPKGLSVDITLDLAAAARRIPTGERIPPASRAPEENFRVGTLCWRLHWLAGKQSNGRPEYYVDLALSMNYR